MFAGILAMVTIMLAVAGCSGGIGGGGAGANVKVSGTVTRNGKPLPVGREGMLTVSLISTSDPNQKFGGEGEEGRNTFRIFAIPPGVYKVAVQQLDGSGRDVLKGAYSEANTTLEQQITAENEQTIVIDLK
jgi:hypothetical protein